MEMITKRGYEFYGVASAIQKAIRRNEPAVAGYFALELYHSGYWFYLWKRLLTISAEDVYEPLTNEIYSLFQSFLYINKNEKEIAKGRVFISKAILILCEAKKCRDSDLMGLLIYDKNRVTEKQANEFLSAIDNSEKKELPKYTYDCHTKIGKMLGKTKDDFLRAELKALDPKQQGLFDILIDK